ncbi:MAG: hypothetical protein KDA28_06905 [Phycisphaerales bacterium]|nr:hypothetical protein [Phycisphaerales bacterium]
MTRCLFCDYDLSGVALDGVCPECGTAVRDTLRESELVRLPPATRRAVRDLLRVLFVVQIALVFVSGLGIAGVLAVNLTPYLTGGGLAMLVAALAVAVRLVLVAMLGWCTNEKGVSVTLVVLAATTYLAGALFPWVIAAAMLIDHLTFVFVLRRLGSRLATMALEFDTQAFVWLGPVLMFGGCCFGPSAYFTYASFLLYEALTFFDDRARVERPRPR